MKISILDPSIGSLNAGDSIIMEAVLAVVGGLFGDYMGIRIPTQSKISRLAYAALAQSKYRFVGGTNLLSSHMLIKKQWKIDAFDAYKVRDVLLLGVGWWQYQAVPDVYTRVLLRNILDRNFYHSVRDAHTKLQLDSIGIKNVLNTSCPTMWGLTGSHCADIPMRKAEDVVFTLTDYNKQPSLDSELVRILARNYSKLYFWPQGSGDLFYLEQLKWSDKVIILSEGLQSFSRFIESPDNDVDFVGTRLHGGVRALQRKRRTIIIGIDNRAQEKAKDFNLKVVRRDQIDKIEREIKSEFSTDIRLPQREIDIWKSQFV